MSASPPIDRIAREETIFNAAIELRDPAKRAVYLDLACEGDPALRARLEKMLAADKDHFFEAPLSSPPLTDAVAAVIPQIADAEPATLGERIGRYKLLERIGEGGCGIVYMAEQEQPVRRRVALKIIKLGMDTKSVIARFEAERQALAMMDHPNIAKVFDAGTTENGRPYFVMELVRGVKVTEYCDRNSLSTRDRLELFIKACQAIQHAHQKGIIHRDIKPSNVLVTVNDGMAVPKVIDFGIAKATNQQQLTDKTLFTAFEQFIGTPAYMSPEQAVLTSLDIDTRSDIYSLGVLLYELLTGKTPFDPKELLASGLDEMRRTIRDKEPVRPSTRLSTMLEGELTTTAKHRQSNAPKLVNLLRGDVDWIVMKCLEKDRTRRYDTANGLAADLKRHLNHETVTARPPSTAYRFQKAFRRNKLVFTAATAVAAALVAGIAVSSWQTFAARKAQRETEAARKGEETQRREAWQAQANEAQLRREAEVLALAERRRAYASDMNLVQQSIAQNNSGRARELLNRHRPATKSEVDLRGWEWRYLWQFCQSDALLTLCHQTNTVSSLASSRDGRWLAVGEWENGGLSVWDLRTRQEIARPDAGKGLVAVAFSPREALLAFSTQTQPWSQNSQYAVHLWDVVKRQLVATLPVGGLCPSLTFAEDGHSLVTIAEAAVTVWSVPEGRKLASFGATGIRVSGAQDLATRDLSLAAYGISDGRIRVIDLATGRERWSAKAADEIVMGIAFSPDGNVLASSAGYVEGTIKLWDVASGREIGRLEGHRSWVCGLAFWPDGKTLASASSDQTIRLWDISDPAKARPLSVLRGHNGEVWSLTLLPDHATLVSGGKDGSVRLWDTTRIRSERTFSTLPEKVLDWCFAPDGKSLIALAASGQVTRWKGDGFREAQLLAQTDPTPVFGMTGILLACWSPDGRLVAQGSTNGIVHVWDLERGALTRELLAQTGEVRPVAFLPRSNRLIVLHADDSLHEWDLLTGRETQSWQGAATTRSLAISPDERWCITFGTLGASVLRDRSTHSQTNLSMNLRQTGGASFSPDGKIFAAGSWLGIGKVWSIDPPRELWTMRGFLLGINSVAFSADGSRIAAGSGGEEALKLWDTSSNQEVLTLEAEGSNYYQTAFSADGNVLGSRNGLGVLHLWGAPSWEEIARAEAKDPPSLDFGGQRKTEIRQP